MDAFKLTNNVFEALPDYIKYSGILDRGTNKIIQNLRLLNCHKPNNDRIKKVVGNWTWKDSLITIYDINADLKTFGTCGFIMPVKDEYIIKASRKKIMPDEDNTELFEQAEDMAMDYLSMAHEVSGWKGMQIHYRRICPSHCELCDKVHDNDNTARVDIDIEGGEYKIYLACWRQKRHNRLHIGTIAGATPQFETIKDLPAKDLPDKVSLNKVTPDKVASDVDFDDDDFHQSNQTSTKYLKKKNKLTGVFNRVTNNRVINNDSLWSAHTLKEVYSEKSMRELQKSLTLVIHAAMKLGKTKAMIDYIKKYFNFENARIVVLSFRQTFTSELMRVLSGLGFVSYDEVKGSIKNNKVVIQVESLHRLELGLKYDLLIIDESESIFGQFGSGLGARLNIGLSKFGWLMRNTEHVLIMDANISDRTYNIIKRFRNIEEAMYHRNSCKNAMDDTWFITSDRGSWIEEIKIALDKNEKIFIPTNSLKNANTIRLLIMQMFPTKEIMIYTSQTDKSKKKKEFGDVATYWSACDVLIITPTCTAGVSFEKKYFNKVFPYFNNLSCDVETCRQMVARIRNVSTGKHYALFDCKRQFLPVDTKHIRKFIGSTQNILEYGVESNTLENLLTIEYNEHGICKLVENDALIIYLENKRIENLSKNNFVERFLCQIKDTGANIELLNCIDEDAMIEHNLSFIALAKVYTTEETRKVVEAPLLTEEETQNLLNQQQEQMDNGGEELSQEDRLALHKRMLIKLYKVDPEKLDFKFVKKYDNPEIKQVYKNIKMVDNFEQCISEDGFYTTLENIRVLENGKSKLTTFENEQMNPVAGRDYARHRLAIGLIVCCAFKSVKDWVTESDMVDNLKMHHQRIRRCETIMRMSYDYFPAFPITGDKSYLALMLKIVNIVIKEQYDMKIVRVSDKLSFIPRYEINLSSNFNTPHTPVAKRDRPMTIGPLKVTGSLIDKILK
jgi:hypothetical protein